MENKEEKRCLTCKRIIVGKNTLGICSECSRKGKNILTGIGGTIGSVVLFVITKGKKK